GGVRPAPVRREGVRMNAVTTSSAERVRPDQRIFIANRGEIAVRIIEACDRLGFETVLGVSAADRDTLGARRAGRTVVLGGPRPGDSYLNMDAVLQAAVSTGCTAVHPGYGFLSENPEFARKCA